MKRIVLILSLLANAALAVMWVAKPGAESKPAAAETIKARAGAVARDKTPVTASVPGGSNDLSAEDLGALKSLGNLMSAAGGGDLSGLVARLRAQGFPPAMVRAIVSAMVYDKNRPKWRELQADDGGSFWRMPAMNLDPKRLTALRELNRAQAKEIKDLVGPRDELDSNNDFLAAQLQRKYGNFPPEKVNKAEEINRDYNDLTQEIYTLAYGTGGGGQLVLLPEDRERLAYLEKQKHDDLAKVLSPDELLEYDMRTSSTANQLRSQLMGFNPTQDEFTALFKLQQAVDEKLGTTQFMTNDSYRQPALKEIQPEIDEALGPERAAAYTQATDPQYMQVSRLVSRLDLPPTAAADVVGVQKDIQQRATALRSNASLSAADRTAQLNALAEEANGKISSALGGQRGLEAYKQYGGGWMQTLVRSGPVRPPTN